ncbi:Type I restriction modification DNA specificity domain [Klebsiella pneumoniae]|nr:Type I restriction modification DNA specificity domain [Klebsiella pneumoniae]
MAKVIIRKVLKYRGKKGIYTRYQEYDLVTVKRSRGGVIRREHLKGKDISVKSQFYIKEGDFLISKRQIVHGACGLVPKELSGSIVSNEYCVLTGKSGFYLPYMEFLSESLYFQQTCFHSSIGVHIEKMIFKLDSWFKWPFNIPPLSEQKRIVKILSTWDKAISVDGKAARQ